MAGLAFDHDVHRQWYEIRFWKGRCTSELAWCWSGDDWYDLMEKVLNGTPAAESGPLCARLFALGKAVGHEWARDNHVRRIHTRDLDAWKKIILRSREPEAGIGKVESLAAERLR